MSDDESEEGGTYHVYPSGDLREHVLEGTTCWCRPKLDEGVVVHNAMDDRESYERGRKKH